MKKYLAKLSGTFEVTQTCEASSEAEAIEIFKSNMGSDIESTATSMLDVLKIEEVE